MKAGVTKKELVKSLANTLKMTRTGVIDLDLSKDEETVTVYYQAGGTRYINIACNSGIAIIRDVCKAID